MKLSEAYREFVARRDRQTHPNGKFDNGGRWYPSDTERQECCRGIRSPSKAHPYSYMTHCRTLAHVAQLYGVDERELRGYARQQEPSKPKREGGDQYYKAVESRDGKLISYYDQEYRLGEELHEIARQGHGGGYYVYRTKSEAQEFAMWKLTAPWVILRCQCESQYCVYDDKLSFGRITPLEIVYRKEKGNG